MLSIKIEDKERNGEIIITTVLSEIATPAGDTDYDQVLDLLKGVTSTLSLYS